MRVLTISKNTETTLQPRPRDKNREVLNWY
jgi:hypothetical protein